MFEKEFDVIVVGGGHAGAEAAAASANMGSKTLLITMNLQTIGQMSCNPAMGGIAKGQIVREIDAMGGIMGHASDACSIQFKTLNKTKGRAVWALRAQVDKKKYPAYIHSLLKSSSYISVFEDEVVGIATRGGHVSGVKLKKNKS